VYQVLKCIEGYQCSIKHEEEARRVWLLPLSLRKKPDASGSFLMLNACATILEPLDPFVDHPL
jgi:hypothetical protein